MRGLCPGGRALAHGLVAFALVPAAALAQTTVTGPQDYALVDMDRFPTVGEQAVRRGTTSGSERFLLRASTSYRLFKLDRASLRVGYVEFTSGPAGSRFTIPPVVLRALSSSQDQDGDSLSDLGEFVLGSDPNDPDSDDDGILDGAAAQAGTLNDPLLRTGLIASVQLPGNAQDVAARNELVAVALGGRGVALTNVFTRMNPIVIGLVDTPGDARRVALSGTLLAVADGPGGLTIVDISDPPVTPIRHVVPSLLLGGQAQAVAALAGLALVGLSTGELVVVDLASGTLLERVRVATRAIQDVFVAGDVIYVLDAAALHTLALQPGRLAVSASVASPFVALPNARLFAGGGVAYAVHGKGVNTFSLADPLLPVLITASNTTQFGWKQLALNGSGLALAAVSPNSNADPPQHVSLYDARDPARTNELLAEFETPGRARSVTLFNGLGYVADDGAGLQVVSYLPQDRLGIAPTISLSTNQPAIDEVEEGTLLRVTATCADDVQVRSCELYVDGLRAETDGNFPFEFFLLAPRRAVRPQLSVRVKVSDTGGNSTFSDELVIRVQPDSHAPSIVRRVPAPGALTGSGAVVAVFLDEAIDPATVVAANLRVIALDAGGAPVAGALEHRERVLGAFFTPATPLEPGTYRVAVQGLADAAGNQVAAETWDFTVYDPAGVDSDGDGLPDALELALGLNPNDPADADGDLDADGVPNRWEVALGMDLRDQDSDGDAVPDGMEDQDGDRLADWRELALGTDLFDHDTDDDAFTDNDEALRASNPLDPTSMPLRAWASATVARNEVAPAYAIGEELVDVVVKSQAAPEAVSGGTQAPPASVRNNP